MKQLTIDFDLDDVVQVVPSVQLFGDDLVYEGRIGKVEHITIRKDGISYQVRFSTKWFEYAELTKDNLVAAKVSIDEIPVISPIESFGFNIPTYTITDIKIDLPKKRKRTK